MGPGTAKAKPSPTSTIQAEVRRRQQSVVLECTGIAAKFASAGWLLALRCSAALPKQGDWYPTGAWLARSAHPASTAACGFIVSSCWRAFIASRLSSLCEPHRLQGKMGEAASREGGDICFRALQEGG